jgi:predicted alpha/beta hydrolase
MKRAFLAQEWRNAHFGYLWEKRAKRLGHHGLLRERFPGKEKREEEHE